VILLGQNMFQRSEPIDQIGANRHHAMVVNHVDELIYRNLKVAVVEQHVTANE